jgi:cell division protein FtsB
MIKPRLIKVVSLALLATLFVSLQYSLWVGKQNVSDLFKLNQQVDEALKENIEFRSRNDRLHVDVIDIKNGAIEAHARYNLGLIKRGETFYQIVRSEED